MDISRLTPIALCIWATNKYEEYEKSTAAKWADEAEALLSQVPEDEDTPDSTERWQAAVEERLNYLLSRPPVIQSTLTDDEAEPVDTEGQEELMALLPAVREYAAKWICRGHAIWLMQGDGTPQSVIPQPTLMNAMITLYADDKKQQPICRIRKYTEVEIDALTGEETEYPTYEIYRGNWKYTYDKARPEKNTEEQLASEPIFIEIGATGDKSIWAKVRAIAKALDKVFIHQDRAVMSNTRPLTEIRGYRGTDPYEAAQEIEDASVILTDGTSSALNVHQRPMDSNSIDMWRKALLRMFYEGTGTVGKEDELQYAVSGKALDRLFVTAEAAAVALGDLLEPAIKKALRAQGVVIEAGLVWNTDRPVDDQAIINGLLQSQEWLSRRTILEQHPWVEDVDKELERKAEEQASGIGSLFLDSTEGFSL